MSPKKIKITKTIATVQMAFVVIVLAVLAIALRKNISRSIYDERKELLGLSANTAASIVDQNSAKEWDRVEVLREVFLHACSDHPVIDGAIAQTNIHQNLEDDYYFLVDRDGKYYASDGVRGKLVDFTEFKSSTPDRLDYLSTLPHMDPGTTYMIHRERLSSPVCVGTGNADVDILYFCYAQDLSGIRKSITDLFPGSINIFIYDEKGTMLYREFGITLLIQGYNIYPKFHQSKYMYGEKPEDMIRKCKDKEPFVVELGIGGNDYYFYSSPLQISGLSLALIVKSETIENITGSSFKNIILSILLIVILLGVAVIGVIAISIRRKAAEKRLTESEAVSRALEAASKAKTDFLSNMSHDIRTPINGIMGMTTLALGVVDNPEKTQNYLGKIDKASHHLLSLVNDVLDMSRIESGKIEIKVHPSDIRTIIDNCASIVGGQLTDRNLEFNVEVDAVHTRILADELHLRQILINLLGNAVKFTPDEGKIWFRCSESRFNGNCVSYRIEVQDTGIGMKSEFLDHIFEPFSQEEKGGRGNYNGTGLGMSITKRLVELMGGVIDVESEYGKGSKFSIDLSFDVDDSPVVEEKADSKSSGIKGIRILLAEDNELNREIAVELLSMNGAEVDTVENGLQAVREFSSNPEGTWDVILMDLMMPEMNGLDATRAIRSLDRPDATKIPILAMTANAFDDDIKATRDAGMNAHISKPIDLADMIRTIKECL